jgi:hypothetical protein
MTVQAICKTTPRIRITSLVTVAGWRLGGAGEGPDQGCGHRLRIAGNTYLEKCGLETLETRWNKQDMSLVYKRKVGSHR